MGEKLEFLIKQKRLTTTSFARMLDVQPSGISHIISGRNKPSFDLVVKILKLFPDVNPDWLLLDDENVWREAESGESLFGAMGADNTTTPGGHVATMSAAMASDVASDGLFAEGRAGVPTATQMADVGASAMGVPFATAAGKSVERIIVLYSDKSFDSYSPTKR